MFSTKKTSRVSAGGFFIKTDQYQFVTVILVVVLTPLRVIFTR